MIVVEMNDSFHLKMIVNQAEMSSDRDVAMIGRRLGKAAPQVLGRGVHFLAQIPIKGRAFAEPGFLVCVEAILVSETGRRMILVLVIPVAGSLTILVIN
jgi:hypothetical protein